MLEILQLAEEAFRRRDFIKLKIKREEIIWSASGGRQKAQLGSSPRGTRKPEPTLMIG